MRRAIHVLVVDDSAVMRQFMVSVLSRQRDMTVEAASDPLIALRKMRCRRPDVILLDIEMPRMDGLTFLRKIMAEDPIPVVVCSGHTQRGSETAILAQEYGAVAILAKPQQAFRDFLKESAVLFIDAVRGAAKARLERSASVPVRLEADAGSTAVPGTVVAIGASTGGPKALRRILEALPVEAPGILVVQHMPEGFTAAFAARLNETCRVEVREAADGDLVLPGQALIAPGSHHLLLAKGEPTYRVRIDDGPLVSRHRPSADVLFRSVARVAGTKALGVILTGMGADGADGLLEMRQAGAVTIAQDEASCVVFGMPRAAIARGAIGEVAPLSDVPALILGRPQSKDLEAASR